MPVKFMLSVSSLPFHHIRCKAWQLARLTVSVFTVIANWAGAGSLKIPVRQKLLSVKFALARSCAIRDASSPAAQVCFAKTVFPADLSESEKTPKASLSIWVAVITNCVVPGTFDGMSPAFKGRCCWCRTMTLEY